MLPDLSFVLDPPKFCCVISNKSAQISQNFRAVTACGQRHHKFELLFPQLFERGAEDYADRGRRGVAGRARSGVRAPGRSLQPIVSVIPALNDATSGGTASGSMDPPRETKRASFSKVGLFRSCAPDRPNLEKRRVKAGPTQIPKQISRNLGQGQPAAHRPAAPPARGGTRGAAGAPVRPSHLVAQHGAGRGQARGQRWGLALSVR